jgi:prephenate dehydratase
MPIPGSDFKYSFHADMEFGSAEQFKRVIKKIEGLTDELTVLGIYKNGKI